MRELVGKNHRTVYWVGPPVAKDSDLEDGRARPSTRSQREAAAQVKGVTYVDAHALFADENGEYQQSFADELGERQVMRAGDGVHFSVDGADYIGRAIFKLLDQDWNITAQADPTQPQPVKETKGSTQVPGTHRSVSSSSGGSSSGTTSTTRSTYSATLEHHRDDEHVEHHRHDRHASTHHHHHDEPLRRRRPERTRPSRSLSAWRSVGCPAMTDTHAAAGAAIDAAAALVDTAARHLARSAADDGRISVSKLDQHQVVAYDLAHAAARGRRLARDARLRRARRPRGEARVRLHRRRVRRHRRPARRPRGAVGRRPGRPRERARLRRRAPRPAFLEALADELPRHGTGPAHLDDEFDMVRDTFHRFAEDKIRPVAEHIHRTNADIPDEIIDGMAEIGGFGLSVPEEYGGFAAGGESDYLAMCVATEELSWGSLGAGGALITRPEILTRAIVKGGTEEQKHGWLPADRERRAHRRRDGDRARLRLRRRRREGDRDAGRRRLRASTA